MIDTPQTLARPRCYPLARGDQWQLNNGTILYVGLVSSTSVTWMLDGEPMPPVQVDWILDYLREHEAERAED